jgi:hypothetical protein
MGIYRVEVILFAPPRNRELSKREKYIPPLVVMGDETGMPTIPNADEWQGSGILWPHLLRRDYVHVRDPELAVRTAVETYLHRIAAFFDQIPIESYRARESRGRRYFLSVDILTYPEGLDIQLPPELLFVCGRLNLPIRVASERVTLPETKIRG